MSKNIIEEMIPAEELFQTRRPVNCPKYFKRFTGSVHISILFVVIRTAFTVRRQLIISASFFITSNAWRAFSSFSPSGER